MELATPKIAEVCKGTTVIFTRVIYAMNHLGRRLAITYRGAAQVALFAMMLQVMIPFSAAITLPGEDGQRNGQSLPSFYLIICTAYGAQSLLDAAGEPLDKDPPATTPWDCPVCMVQASLHGPVPDTPQVAFVPPTLPREANTPRSSDFGTQLWSAAPGLARAPPAA